MGYFHNVSSRAHIVNPYFLSFVGCSMDECCFKDDLSLNIIDAKVILLFARALKPDFHFPPFTGLGKSEKEKEGAVTSIVETT